MPADKRGFAPIDFKTRFPALDGIRALAITMVFACHYGGGSHGGMILRAINAVRERGWVGVDLFFVLSGFLITGILYDTSADSRFFSRFYIRRSLRILPVFYIVVLLVLLLTPIFHYEWHWMQLTFVFYVGNFFANYHWDLYQIVSANHPAADVGISHFWSLCVEEQFYLIWPLVVWFVRDRVKLIGVAVGISAVSLALRFAMIGVFGRVIAETWIIRTLPFRMDSLLIGGILALVLRGPAADRWQRASKWVFAVFLGAALAVFIFSPAYDSPWLLSVGLTFNALASAGLIGMTLRPGSPAYQLFHLKPLRVLGKYSYGFYVYHLLFATAWIDALVSLEHRLHSLALPGLILLPMNYLLVFLVSKASYDWIEVRFLRLKRHFEYDSEIAEHRHAFAGR
ncbi:MAG TPA: acyltransferase [Acidobacteriaceae bacterium]|nr:acyltransferase [Acidobacteriaceae bacterium]